MRLAKILAPLCLLACLLFAPSSARSEEPTPNSVSPPLSFCIGKTTTCVMPDFGLSVINYDLDAKKWAGGVQKASAGYELLFFSDQPYASGFSLHASFNVGQYGGSYFSPSAMLVLFKYFEAGATFEFGDGYIGKFISLGTSVPIDLLSGATMADRLKNARLLASRMAGGNQLAGVQGPEYAAPAPGASK